MWGQENMSEYKIMSIYLSYKSSSNLKNFLPLQIVVQFKPQPKLHPSSPIIVVGSEYITKPNYIKMDTNWKTCDSKIDYYKVLFVRNYVFLIN